MLALFTILALLLILLLVSYCSWHRISELERQEENWVKHSLLICRQRDAADRRCREMEELMGTVEGVVREWRRKP